jgi:hypothetical protein
VQQYRIACVVALLLITVSRGEEVMAKVSRRGFVKRSLLVATGAVLGAKAEALEQPSATQQPVLPKGKIRDLEISRLLLGGNLLTHFTHSRDLRYVYTLTRYYNTDAKILETLAIAEAHGINTLIIHYVPKAIQLLQEHRRRGGKMQWITCTAHALASGGLDEFKRQMDALVEAGANALYISGVEGDFACGFHNDVSGPNADERVGPVRLDLLNKALEHARSYGLPVGIGAHRMGVVEDCEKAGFNPDFYMVTFHHLNYPSARLCYDSRWCSRPDELATLMQSVNKPWIAFKVMAAGAIPPESAFRFAYENGADFIVAGMFDFEIPIDVRIACNILSELKGRKRPWHG